MEDIQLMLAKQTNAIGVQISQLLKLKENTTSHENRLLASQDMSNKTPEERPVFLDIEEVISPDEAEVRTPICKSCNSRAPTDATTCDICSLCIHYQGVLTSPLLKSPRLMMTVNTAKHCASISSWIQVRNKHSMG